MLKYRVQSAKICDLHFVWEQGFLVFLIWILTGGKVFTRLLSDTKIVLVLGEEKEGTCERTFSLHSEDLFNKLEPLDQGKGYMGATDHATQLIPFYAEGENCGVYTFHCAPYILTNEQQPVQTPT